MKKLLMLTTLLAPHIAFAAVCDTTDLTKIEQRYIDTAPDCIASGDYSSRACGGVRQAHEDSILEIAQLRSSGCDYRRYQQDVRVEQNNKLVDSLPDSSAIKTKAMARKYDGTEVCTDLIVDITRNYYVSQLQWMHNGNPHVTQDLVSCTYKAVTPEMWGDRPVMVIALLNTSNNRFTVEIR